MVSTARKGPLDKFSEAILNYNRAREVGSRILGQDAPEGRLWVNLRQSPVCFPRPELGVEQTCRGHGWIVCLLANSGHERAPL